MFEKVIASLKEYTGEKVVISISSSAIEYIDNVDVNDIMIEDDLITINVNDMYIYIHGMDDLEVLEETGTTKEINLFYKSKNQIVTIEFPLM